MIRRLPYLFKLITGWFFIVFVFLCLCFLALYLKEKSFIEKSRAEGLEEVVKLAEKTVLPVLSGGNKEALKQALKDLSETTGLQFAYHSSDGSLSAEFPSFEPDRLPFHHFPVAPSENYIQKQIVDDKIIVIAGLETNQQSAGFLEVRKSIKNDLVQNNVYFIIILSSMIFSAILFLFCAYFIAKIINRPISDLAAGFTKVKSGDFDARLFPDYSGEWQKLANQFNEMVSSLKKIFTGIHNENEQLRTVVSSIQGGFIILDNQRSIITANPIMKKLIDEEHPEGRFYWEVIRDLRLLELFERTESARSAFFEEIEIRDRIYLAFFNYLQKNDHITAILYDITGAKNLEKIKKDFAANVSHELKTPLTSIKGFLETLKDSEKDPEKTKYLDIILRNTDRLIGIVKDLLTLSEIEAGGSLKVIEKVPIPIIIDRTVKLYEKKIASKGLKLNLELDENLPIIDADPFQLEQVFINLIDNAVKYTEKGSITIKAYPAGEYLKIEFSDTGIGISEKDIPRLFERFYVADKSRSRSLGGTGLGLSIVKHIVQLHRGQIDIQSGIGSGTRFIVTLPVKLKE